MLPGFASFRTHLLIYREANPSRLTGHGYFPSSENKIPKQVKIPEMVTYDESRLGVLCFTSTDGS